MTHDTEQATLENRRGVRRALMALALIAAIVLAISPPASADPCRSMCGQGRGICNRLADVARAAAQAECDAVYRECRVDCVECDAECSADREECRTFCLEDPEPDSCNAECEVDYEDCRGDCVECYRECNADKRECRQDAQDERSAARDVCKAARESCHATCRGASDQECVNGCGLDARPCLRRSKDTEGSCRAACPDGAERNACRKGCQNERMGDDAECVGLFGGCVEECSLPVPQ